MSDDFKRKLFRPLTPEEIKEIEQDINDTCDRLLADLREMDDES